ncbi:MAG: CRISPR-associated endonuclease Cas4g/Cas1g [Myxococcota bacterium]|jgi:CRISPR-associated endonuclease Cas1/CRISPR-associated protein Cas4
MLEQGKPDLQSLVELIPARMLNEYVYCPRLAYLEWVQGEFEDSEDTIAGRHDHRRVDVAGPLLPDPEEVQDAIIHARSVTLSAADPGIIAKMDLVEALGRVATPVDYKHGKRPAIPGGVWDADLVQIGAQAVVLRANGYECNKGVVYYVGSKERVEVEISEKLLQKVTEACEGLRKLALSDQVPPPLNDSPKCPGCSLVGICLPDETNLLGLKNTDKSPDLDMVRRLYPLLPDCLPVYIQDQGAYVGKSEGLLKIKVNGEQVSEVAVNRISQVVLFGNVQITTQAVRELCSAGVPICYMSYGGWFYGFTAGFGSRNITIRKAQFQKSEDPEFCLKFARRIVWAKIQNQRTMLRRNSKHLPADILRRMTELSEQALNCEALPSLLGIEGNAARLYFEHFHTMLSQKGDSQMGFNFETRNRRPPLDPVNAMLSFCYSMLAKDCAVTLKLVGFDPFLGFYHTAHHGRHALALDLMEEFRPLLADSTVLSVINQGEIQSSDFVKAARAVSLKPAARRKLIKAYERRLDQCIAHPIFGYKVSYRKILEIQSRLLSRLLLGEITEFPAILTR